MAHFAEIDSNDAVLRVVVVHDDDAPDEATGVVFCQALYGKDTCWLQTSYNAKARANYAGPGYTYRKDLDAFVSPQPSEKHVLDEKTCQWVDPEETVRPDAALAR